MGVKRRWIKKNLYVKLLLWMVAIAIIPQLLTATFFYTNTKGLLEQEIEGSHKRYMNQTVNAFEIVIRQIMDSSRQVMLDSDMQNYESFPRRQYYESLVGQYAQEDLPQLGSYLNTKKNIFGKLRVMKSSNQFIHAVYYWDRTNGEVMTSDEVQYSADMFYDRSVLDLISASDHFPPLIMDRIKTEAWGGERPVVTVLYKSLRVNGENYLIIDLDTEVLHNQIIQKLAHPDLSGTYVMSPEGEVVIGRNTPGLAFELDVSGELHSGTMFSRGNDQKSYLVTYQQSPTLGWFFVTYVEADNVYRVIRFTRMYMIAIYLVFVAVIMYLIHLSSRNLHRPIQSILSKVAALSSKDAIDREPVSDNELVRIEHHLEHARRDREELDRQLAESFPAYRNQFLVSLVEGRLYSIEELRQRFSYFRLNLTMEYIIVLTLHSRLSAIDDRNIESLNMNQLEIANTLHRLLAGRLNGLVFEKDEGRHVVIANCAHEQLASAFDYAEAVRAALSEQLQMNCIVGISRISPSILELGRAYKEAEEALKYRIGIGYGEIIYIEDVSIGSHVELVYSREKESTLLDYLKIGDHNRAVDLFHELNANIAAQNQSATYKQMHQFYFHLLSRMVEVLDDIGIRQDEWFADRSLYAELAYKNNREEIIHWFIDLISAIAACVGEAYNQKDNRYIESIKRIVEEDTEGVISLGYVASRMNLSPSYVSRIFKQHTRINFSSYLTGHKMEQAKKLLRESATSVKEISVRLGYHNYNYFIQLFRENTGTTPGEYRKMQ